MEYSTFWDIPGMKSGVITGDCAWNLLKFAKATGFAIPSFNCTTSSSVNAVLEAGSKIGRPVMIQFSEADSAFFCGSAVENRNKEASILGAVAGAHYVRNISPAYGIPCFVHSDSCAKKLLPWLDGMLEADQEYFKVYGQPLFTSHMLDLSEEPHDSNVGTSAEYFKKMSAMDLILEMKIGKATPADAKLVWDKLSPISEKFTIAAAGSVQLLDSFQKDLGPSVGVEKPYFFVSQAEEKDLGNAVRYGAVKVNVDTDAQWAYWEGLLNFYNKKSGYLQGQIGNPDGADKPNKSYYDPRKWVRESEVSLCARVQQCCKDFRAGVAPQGVPSTLPADVVAELEDTARKLCAPGKGFLAADESAGPWLRAGHVEAAKIPDTAENRAAYRSMCFSTPGLAEFISGVILHWETLFQDDKQGRPMVEIITKNGMIPGIKVDKAYNKKGMWGTAVGPLGHPEVSTLGLDDLQQRCSEAYKRGARFAKWRNVLQLDPEKGLPSEVGIADAVHTLARYASICQSEGLVPIVEPEIVPNGTHDIFYCAEMTEKVLNAQFEALKLHNVHLPGAVLKPNMVKNGIKGPRADPETIATLTVQTLLRTVPSAMPGIFFLSGETALDEDNEEVATINLSTMNKLFKPKMPWHLSFSYGKALQKTCIVTWLGKEENKAAAQKALKARANANYDAVFGRYVPKSCASVGVDGNVTQAAGPY